MYAKLFLDGEDDFRRWIRSDMFKPFWDELWTSYIKPSRQVAKRKGIDRARGRGLKEIQTLIVSGEKGGLRKYSRTNPDKRDWCAADHYARFLLQTRSENIIDADGQFYGKQISESDVDMLIWAVMTRVSFEHSPSRINRPGGGNDLMGAIVDDEVVKDGTLGNPSSGEGSPSVANQTGSDLPENNTDPVADAPKKSPRRKRGGRNPPHKKSKPRDVVLKPVGSSLPAESGDSDSDSEEDDAAGDAVTVAVNSDAWKDRVLRPKEKLQLSAVSATMDMSEPFWKYKFIEIALKACMPNAVSDAVEDDDESVAEGSASENAVVFASVYDASRYLDAESIDWHKELTAAEVGDVTETDNASIIVPTQESLELFQKQQKWFDNKEYQRENHQEACRRLMISNLDMPKIPGMRPGIVLKFWQPVAIDGLCEFKKKEYLRGSILADAVGFGKTFITIGFLLAVSYSPVVAFPRPSVSTFGIADKFHSS